MRRKVHCAELSVEKTLLGLPHTAKVASETWPNTRVKLNFTLAGEVRAWYGKKESRKEHKAGSEKGGLNYCEIKENTEGSGIRRKRLKQARDRESGERSGHRGNIRTSEIMRKRNYKTET